VLLIIIFAIIITIATGFAAFAVGSRDVVSPIDVVNTGGSKAALLVYQLGLSSQTKDVSYAFADGLASSGWRVEITTASTEVPSDMANYSLLVLAWPIYGGAAGAATVRYVDRISNLHGIQTVLIAVGGSPGKGFDTMTQKVQAANGTVVKSLAPNEGNGNATEIARQAGAQIQP
jgi:menaquinone-dependent protoporphyrinogen IX oxidase